MVSDDTKVLKPSLDLKDDLNQVEGFKLSMNSVVKLTEHSTMKLERSLLSNKVTILIDCNAIDNFIIGNVVECLRIPILETTNYGVLVGNDQLMNGKGGYKSILVELKGLTVVEDYLSIPMKRFDLILCIK